MSTDKVEKRESPEQKQGVFETVELEKKLMQIEEDKYAIDIKQNGESRFCRIIEMTKVNRRSRIVVPMCVVSDFLKKLGEITKFASTYNPTNMSEKKAPGDRTSFAFSSSHTTPGGRRYYFDLIDAGDSLNVRISYVFIDRDSINIIVDGVTGLCQILEDYQKKYPSLTPNDDYPLSARRRNFGRSGRPGDRSPRGFNKGRFRRQFGGQRSQGFHNGGVSSTASKVPSDPKRATTLKVLSEPAPTQVVHNAKKFTLEIVEGANVFLRITEIINDVRKSTLHVPIEVCSKMQTLIGDMNKKLTINPKPSSATPSK